MTQESVAMILSILALILDEPSILPAATQKRGLDLIVALLEHTTDGSVGITPTATIDAASAIAHLLDGARFDSPSDSPSANLTLALGLLSRAMLEGGFDGVTTTTRSHATRSGNLLEVGARRDEAQYLTSVEVGSAFLELDTSLQTAVGVDPATSLVVRLSTSDVDIHGTSHLPAALPSSRA